MRLPAIFKSVFCFFIFAGFALAAENVPARFDQPWEKFYLHKQNYFIVNSLPPDASAQVKFQISIKYRVFDGWLHHLLPFYFAYSQKSFWDIGKFSKPFDENNYNPEVFFDYNINWAIFPFFKWRHLLISPYEHESNGLAGPGSRSWNRACLGLVFGFGPEVSPGKDSLSLQLRFWYPFDYSDQNDFLLINGYAGSFLNYAGWGEASLVWRRLPLVSAISLLANNQLRLATRIFRDSNKGNLEISYEQNLPPTNFSLFFQYWHGYDESLLRFHQPESKFKTGISFFN